MVAIFLETSCEGPLIINPNFSSEEFGATNAPPPPEDGHCGLLSGPLFGTRCNTCSNQTNA